MGAGDHDDIADASPALADLDAIYECGEIGTEQALKLINNIICAANFAITGETLRLALECRLDVDSVTAVPDVSTRRNFMSDGPGTAQSHLRQWTPNRKAFDSYLSILRKDFGLAAAMATSTNSGPYVGLAGLSALMSSLGSETYEHWRIAAGAPSPEESLE
ncbi:NAD-binding protein [Rhodococcus sp. NPDC057529]|uniref:NAD-binding protein n=1 Tax=Rhodococcus sp. NPDC057529 TaxID=3346158 RepID=UPI0036709635